MQMLEAGGLPPFVDDSASAAHRAADASNPRGYYELDAVRRLRAGAPWLHDADGHAVKVVAPLLALLPAGPAYRVVFVLRQLGEVLASQRAMLERLGRPAGDPDVLRGAFQRQVDAARSLLERDDRFTALYVEHAALIHRPAEAAREIAAFLAEADVTLNPVAMARVVDPALYRAQR